MEIPRWWKTYGDRRCGQRRWRDTRDVRAVEMWMEMWREM